MPRCELEQDFTGLMEPATKFTETHGLLVAQSVSTSKNGLTIIRLLNPSTTPITVHQFEQIGTFHSMEVTAVHTVDATGPEIVTTMSTQEEINVAIGKMMSGSEDLSCAESDKLRTLLASYIDVISTSEADLGRASKLRHTITTDGSPPIKQAPRRLPFNQHQEVLCSTRCCSARLLSLLVDPGPHLLSSLRKSMVPHGFVWTFSASTT